MSCLAPPIDLRERFGTRFRIGRDPAAGPRSTVLWYATVPCARGTIYADGPEHLRADIDGRPKLARMVAAVAGVEIVQDGDGETTVRFHVGQFEAVAALVRPFRRRVLSDERRDRLRLVGAAHRFPARSTAQDEGSET
jgi:hypothetical protein